jgi:outer membrane protein assembly factor BamB
MCVLKDKLYYKTPLSFHCVNSRTGKENWQIESGVSLEQIKRKKKKGSIIPWFVDVFNVPLAIALEDMVLLSSENKLRALSAKDGSLIWSGPGANAFYNPPEIMVVDNSVWAGYRQLDLKTGKPDTTAKVFGVGMKHHRCYRKKATSNYLLASEAGVEFYEFKTGNQYPNHWTRSGCMSGVLPANGLLYITPHPCACFNRVEMNGLLSYDGDRNSAAAMTKPLKRLERGPVYDAVATKAPTAPGRKGWPIYRQNVNRTGSTTDEVSAKLSCKWTVEFNAELSPVTVVGNRVFVAAVDEHKVYALDADTGKTAWTFTTGARVDTPPSITSGLAIFGSRDGWVYCVRVADGALVWRFNGTPGERLIAVKGQLESAWPIHGSVLIMATPGVNQGRPVAYFSAGRNSFLDNGIFIYGLDAMTGAIIGAHQLKGPIDKKGNPIVEKTFYIKGMRSDLLVAKDKYFFMRDMAFDMNCRENSEVKLPHLMTTGSSLVNDRWFHRTNWIIDMESTYNLRGTAYGNILCYTDNRIYSLASHAGGRTSGFNPERGYTFRGQDYTVRSRPAEKNNIGERAEETSRKSKSKVRGPQSWVPIQAKTAWKQQIDVVFKGMVLTGVRDDGSGGILFAAGPPNLKKGQAMIDALHGRKGAYLWAVSTESGSKLAEYKLDAPPVFDGMAAISGKLFISQTNGKLVCMASD